MTLAVGTALKNGTYVIDAWVAEDTIGPVYLAMDVSQGQWVQLRVLGSRSPQTLPEASDRQEFYRYLDQVANLQNQAFPARLGGFEEEGVCYQILPSPIGVPLDRLVTPANPLSPPVSLAIVHHLVEALKQLRPLGWAGLQLTADQVWYAPATQTTTFVGFDLASDLSNRPELEGNPVPPEKAPENTSEKAPENTSEKALENTSEKASEEAVLVRKLSDLLYFLLAGQRAETTQAPLAVEVRRRYPALPSDVDAALDAGSPRDRPWPQVTLADWGALLPALPAIESLPPAPLTVAAPERSAPAPATMAPPKSSRRLTTPALALGITGLVATFSGLGFGLYARLHPAASASQERLNPSQSFPPLPNWNSKTLWQPWDDAPTLRSRPDYGNTPPPGSNPANDFVPNIPEPAAPPPVVTQPEPEPEPTPNLTDDWESPVEPWVAPEPIAPVTPTPLPEVAPAPAPAPVTPPAPLEAPPPLSPKEVAPPPMIVPPRPDAPAPTSS